MSATERIADFLKVAKNHIDKGNFTPWKGSEPLNLYPGYLKAMRQRDQIAIHSTKDEFPEKEFRRLMSNMEEQGIDWLKDNYQPVTHSKWNEFISTMKRACYNVGYEDSDVDEKVVKYLQKDVPKYQNLDNYYKQLAPPLIAQDGMSVFSIVPETVPTEETEDGMVVISGDINPMPQYFECWRVLHFENDKECLIIRAEKSMVTFGNQQKPYGLIFDYYTDERIERWVQVGKMIEFNFAITMDFEHGLDYMPAWRAGGLPEIIDNDVVYSSHFSGALPHLNNAMEDAMLLKSIKFKCAFPTPVMVSEPCKYTDPKGQPCKGGILYDYKEDGSEVEIQCPDCKGSGKSQKLNVFSTMYAPSVTRDNPEKYSASDVLTYVSPSTETMVFMRKETDLNLSRASEELHIVRQLNQDGDRVTATEVGRDDKAAYAFIHSFASIWATLYNNGQKAATQMKWGINENTRDVIAPTDFDLKTSDDYLAQIKAAQDSGVPPVVMSKIISDYMYSEVEGSRSGERMIETIIAADGIFQMGGIESTAMREKIKPWQLTLHLSSYNIITNLINENEDWLNQDLDKRVADMQAKAQELTPAQTNSAVDALNGMGGGES